MRAAVDRFSRHGYNPEFCTSRQFWRLPYAKLGRPREVEALRWAAFLRFDALWERSKALETEVFEQEGHDAFIPSDYYDEEKRSDRDHPRRIYADKGHNGNVSVNYDDEYWRYEPAKHQGTPLEVIAAAGALGEWEKITLPGRLSHVTSEKLALGLRYAKIQARIDSQRTHCWKLNEALFLSVYYCQILPVSPNLVEKLVNVDINGRLYAFKVRGRSYGHPDPDYNHWPLPDDPPLIEAPEGFEFDDSLIGKDRTCVRTRHGEPDLKLPCDEWEGNVWLYGDVGVAFEHDRVASYLSPRRVAEIRAVRT